MTHIGLNEEELQIQVSLLNLFRKALEKMVELIVSII